MCEEAFVPAAQTLAAASKETLTMYGMYRPSVCVVCLYTCIEHIKHKDVCSQVTTSLTHTLYTYLLQLALPRVCESDFICNIFVHRWRSWFWFLVVPVR